MATNALIKSKFEDGELVYRARDTNEEVFRISASGVTFPSQATQAELDAVQAELDAHESATTSALAGKAPMATAYPAFKSGHYYYAGSPGGNATSGALGNGTPRVLPMIVPYAVSIAKIGAEFTVAGDNVSILRLGVWNDDGTGIPGTLALDAGSISTGTSDSGTVATGGTPGTYEITLGSPLVLTPGLYWLGAVVQGVTVTQPTIRIALAAGMSLPISQLTTKPGTGFNSCGFAGASQTGALATFATPAVSSNIPRLFFSVT